MNFLSEVLFVDLIQKARVHHESESASCWPNYSSKTGREGFWHDKATVTVRKCILLCLASIEAVTVTLTATVTVKWVITWCCCLHRDMDHDHDRNCDRDRNRA
jgi:hypothetical protein